MVSREPQTSVIVVNYNGSDHLGDLLDSLAGQTQPVLEVILVDNASSDGSVELVRERFPWVKLLPQESNVGFTKGNNIGFQQASGEYIALLNNDTVVDEAWLGELEAALDSAPEVGAAVPKILLAASPQTIDCAGAEFNNVGFCWGRGSNRPDRGQFSEVEEVPVATGCSMLLRRAALGGETIFDQELFMYYEELELSLRLRGRGFRILYVPSSTLFHKRGISVGEAALEPLLFQQLYGNRNRVKILAKYYPLPTLLANLHLVLGSLAYWNFFFLRHGGPGALMRALSGQIRFAVHGIRERSMTKAMPASRWLPWMTHHSLRQILRLKRDLGSYSQ